MGRHQVSDFGEDLSFNIGREVDEDLPKEDDIHRRDPNPGLDQVDLSKARHRADFGRDLPVHSISLEEAHERLRGQASIDFDLGVAPLGGLAQDFIGEVGSEQLYVKGIELREVLFDQHGDRLEFLSGGAGCRPDSQFAFPGKLSDQIGEDFGS